MRKLTLKDKFILIENQRYIEAKTESEEISIIKLLVWFYKINKRRGTSHAVLSFKW